MELSAWQRAVITTIAPSPKRLAGVLQQVDQDFRQMSALHQQRREMAGDFFCTVIPVGTAAGKTCSTARLISAAGSSFSTRPSLNWA
jgi:hypothetical protein